MSEKKAPPKRSRSLKLLLACIGLILLAGAAFQYFVIEDFASLMGPFKEKKEAPPTPPPGVKQKVPIKMAEERPMAPPAPPAKEEAPAAPQDKAPPKEATPAVPQDKVPPMAAPPDTKPAPPAVLESPPQPPRAMAESPSVYPYSIYLGSYQDLKGARAAVSQYAQMGLSPYWTKVNLGDKGIWYRVFAGYFRTKGEAEDLIKVKQIPEAESKNTRYAVLTGVYRTEGDAGKMLADLLRLGFSPYMIKGEAGDFRVYVGAFYGKAGAEKGHSEMASKGIQGKVVRR